MMAGRGVRWARLAGRAGGAAVALACVMAAPVALAAAAHPHAIVEGFQKIHADDQGEVALGKLGLEKGTSPEVKAFAQQLVTDHGKNDEKLNQLAQEKGIFLGGKAYEKKAKKAREELSELEKKEKGREFDEAYMKKMEKGHAKDEKELAELVEKAKDPEIKSFLQETHATIASHLQHAKETLAGLQRKGGEAQAAVTSPATSGTGSHPADAAR